MRILLVAIALSLLLSGCITGDDDDGGTDPDLTLTNGDAGGTFEVNEGDTIVVELESNPTTGYEWSVDELTPAVLTYTGSEYEPDEGDAVGQGGTQRLSFQAANPGQATLALKYWRSWEGDSSIDQRYTVTIDVTSS
ncbi:MAG: protease inhibitor I42 family protein [Thermomicrobiales bacterium]